MSRRLLVLDACVLIDFYDADATLLGRVVRHVGDVHVALPVFNEVEQIDEATAGRLGLRIVEPTLEDLSEALASKPSGLSLADSVCLLLARQNGWTCVSNDGRLRSACGEARVPVIWGLELLALVAESGGVSPSAARVAGEAIQKNNPRYITPAILRRFLRRIDKL